MDNKTFTETMGYLEAKGFLTPLDEKHFCVSNRALEAVGLLFCDVLQKYAELEKKTDFDLLWGAALTAAIVSTAGKEGLQKSAIAPALQVVTLLSEKDSRLAGLKLVCELSYYKSKCSPSTNESKESSQ